MMDAGCKAVSGDAISPFPGSGSEQVEDTGQIYRFFLCLPLSLQNETLSLSGNRVSERVHMEQRSVQSGWSALLMEDCFDALISLDSV